MSKDSPEGVELVKNKPEKGVQSKPEDKGFGVIRGIVVLSD
jgi:hypothetical protein